MPIIKNEAFIHFPKIYPKSSRVLRRQQNWKH